MRLIDANALYAKAAKLEKEAMEALLNCDAVKDREVWLKFNRVLIERTAFKFDIADAPTIEDRKEGKWTERKVFDKLNAFDEWQSAQCSNCGLYHTTPYMYYFDNYKYCPNCGAIMMETKEGEVDCETN